jgi:mannose-1-phosphate guanylyltransferase
MDWFARRQAFRIRLQDAQRLFMGIAGNTWAIVLAGGNGTRLRSVTTDETGVSVPKQFCSLQGDRSLLDEALARARAVAAPEHVCVVVTEQHRRWWRPALAGMVSANIIVQPDNRGTANGVLLPLLHVINRDPHARIVLLPSDHHVNEESVLAAALQRGISELSAGCEHVVLLGISPDDSDPDLGYIIPGSARAGALSPVSGFVEKPEAGRARSLIKAGALWNTFIVMAHAAKLLEVFAKKFPRTVANLKKAVAQDIETPDKPDATAVVYQTLLNVDFSRDLLAGAESSLCVLPVGRCGWSDLGTPQRLAQTLLGLPMLKRPVPAYAVGSMRDPAVPATGLLNLGRQHARLTAAIDAAGAAATSAVSPLDSRQPASQPAS